MQRKVDVFGSKPQTGGIFPRQWECFKAWAECGSVVAFATWLVGGFMRWSWNADHRGEGYNVRDYDNCFDSDYSCERWVSAQWPHSAAAWAWHALMAFVIAGLVCEVICAYARKRHGAYKDLVEIYRTTPPVDDISGGEQHQRQPVDLRRQRTWLTEVPLLGAVWGAAIGVGIAILTWFVSSQVFGLRGLPYGWIFLGVVLGTTLFTAWTARYWAVHTDELAITEAQNQPYLQG
ncbi:hypothetical protein [Ktedonospora formicarum]|uniref:Uncharacterized protein n=1 Tax=Ktedonospora formicarum TaxID=2778364 RepID=A0A8J3MVL0_9CHLR|nr:hypothetical protein [Ktedonospora formicarum]GHO48041.1 hypothetical protein KSX_62040 [Ktedonospora formicarum]